MRRKRDKMLRRLEIRVAAYERAKKGHSLDDPIIKSLNKPGSRKK
jgi:hypothetical protein